MTFQRKRPLIPPDRFHKHPRGHTVTVRLFKVRGTVRLNCPRCGTTTWGCQMSEVEFYEAVCREHVCGLSPSKMRRALQSRPNLRALLERALTGDRRSVYETAHAAPEAVR
jgi:hypothetical protein